MTDFQTFKQTVQTYGSRPFLNGLDGTEKLNGAFAAVFAEEQALDDALDLYEPPFDRTLADRLMKTIVTEQNMRMLFVFVKRSAWLCLITAICGFCFGYVESREAYAATAEYFNDMFDV